MSAVHPAGSCPECGEHDSLPLAGGRRHCQNCGRVWRPVLADGGEDVNESYCFACDEVVEAHPWAHKHEVHDGEDVEVKRIVRTTTDGERITEPDDGMAHYGSHHFVPVENWLICPKCGAVKIASGGERP